MDAALFRFEDVGVVFDGSIVLDGVDAVIPAHGVTAVVGASGAGKSTLLRLCNRLEVPTSGRVVHRGRDVLDLDPLELRKEVGMVFQKPALFGGTVADNFDVAAPDSSPEKRRQALDQAALGHDYLHRRADTLSGGEAQRLCLARTLLTDPHALLLDEPTSALDTGPKRAFEHTATALTRHGIPIVWVTHELEQVHRIADQVLVLDRGSVVAQLDDPAQIARRTELRQLLEGDHDAQR